MTSDQQNKIRAYVDQQHKAQVEFLAELVKVPSDNPPGDCAPHARRSAELLEKLGFTVTTHAPCLHMKRRNDKMNCPSRG